MDLRTLRFFAAVADHSGFSRAAEQLGISQPALSRQISALERELRVKLFDRVGRQTTLTAAGENLLERARSLLHDADAIKSHAHEIAGGSYGALWLGATPQSIESFVAKLLARFCARTPNVEISILEDGAANLVEATQRGLNSCRDRVAAGGNGIVGTSAVPHSHSGRRATRLSARLQGPHRHNGTRALSAALAQKEFSVASAFRFRLQDGARESESAAREQ